MAPDFYNKLILALPLFLQLVGLLFAVVIDPYIRRTHRRWFLIIIALVFCLVLQSLSEDWVEDQGNMWFIRTLISVIGYSIRPIIIILFLKIIDTQRKFIVPWVLTIINIAMHSTAFYSRICFHISADNHFERGPLGYFGFAISGLLLFWLLGLTFREFTRVQEFETLIPIMNVLTIIVASIFDITGSDLMPISFLVVAIVSCCVFFYIWLHLQFVREHEEALMADQRIKIMMSQIQPHFLYNTLSTIQSLCKIDPDQAFVTTGKFGAYLRQNLDSLSNPDLIPFEKELEHTKIYADIEKLRFPSIEIRYEIMTQDFELPALTLQPMVENAIRHGVRIREHGLVIVRTYQDDNEIVMTIEDNGKGFDVDAAKRDDRSHIGIQNVKERVEDYCGGTFTIESEIDVGTKVTIRIPQ